MEFVELNGYHAKVRRSNNKGYYDIFKRKDETFYCSCPSYRYNNTKCKHIKLIKEMLK